MQDGKTTVVSRCLVGSIRVWDMANGNCLGSFDYPRSKTKVFSTCMDVSTQASMIALGTASG